MLHDLFQSTHPSGVRPYSDDAEDLLKVISIHAPQWGATSAKPTTTNESEFQSTHPSGVRLDASAGTITYGLFQSTHPSGVRRAMEFRTPLTDVISIHAPQWGATSAYHQSPAGALFQSTHPSGVRPTDSAAIVRCKQFQSTHPSGVRPPSGDCGRSATADFNPRTPVGCDSYRHHHNKRFHPFQSTHPSGVRPFDGAKSVGKSSDFNPRTPVGCDTKSLEIK